MALPWQRLFRYIIAVLVAILRLTDIGRNLHIGHQYDMYQYIPTHYMHIYTGYVGIVCKLILVHQLVLYCCLLNAASRLRPFRDSRGVQVPPPPRRF